MSIQPSIRRGVLVAGLLAAPTGAAQAQFLGVSWEEIKFDDAGGGLVGCPRVIRIYADFGSPDDQLVGVVGSPDNPLSVTLSGATFSDSAHELAGDRPPPFDSLSTPELDDLRYDSWFTIGNSSIDVGPAWPSGAPFDDTVLATPGMMMEPVLDGATVWVSGDGLSIAWTCPPTREDPGDGTPNTPTPQTVAGNWPGGRVLFLQLALDDDGDGAMTIEMGMGLLTIADGLPEETGISSVINLEPATCPADVNGDGLVNTQDLSAVIVGWGPCTPSGPCPDTNHDCLVNTQDLAAIILSWNECP